MIDGGGSGGRHGGRAEYANLGGGGAAYERGAHGGAPVGTRRIVCGSSRHLSSANSHTDMSKIKLLKH